MNGDRSRRQVGSGRHRRRQQQRPGRVSKPFAAAIGRQPRQDATRTGCPGDRLESAIRSRCAEHGDGPLRGRLEQEAARRGVAGSTLFVGQVADPECYRRAGDRFALASRAGGMPNVLLETMACGLPAIAT
jgi:hypothetical protein